MERVNWQILWGIALVVLPVLLYLLHYVIFRDAHHILIYLVGDVAFVFVEVLSVTLIIHRLLNEREKQARLEKLNMVIGAFFSEVGTLENPNLLEHESFTELLRAVFHLAEELAARESLTGLPATDQAHLAGDIERVYGLLVHRWLDYMQYLKGNYPYLFSLAIRTNPFDREASPVVQ